MEGENMNKTGRGKERSEEVRTCCWRIVTQRAQSMSGCLVTMSAPQDEAGELRCSHWGVEGVQRRTVVFHTERHLHPADRMQ